MVLRARPRHVDDDRLRILLLRGGDDPRDKNALRLDGKRTTEYNDRDDDACEPTLHHDLRCDREG
jgi:hypothetical protein